ncbi:Uncharacterised protein [uncultured archaeon]|nr:Uncharacterised protein [uncultured archaeon]
MSLRQFLLKKKPTTLLLCLKDTGQMWYPSKLAQASGASYVYVTQWLDKLEKGGWVRMEKRGRLKAVVATEAGLSVASMLDEMVHKMDALSAKGAPAAGTVEQEHASAKPEGQEAKKKEGGPGVRMEEGKKKEGAAAALRAEEKKEKAEKEEKKEK